MLGRSAGVVPRSVMIKASRTPTTITETVIVGASATSQDAGSAGAGNELGITMGELLTGHTGGSVCGGDGVRWREAVPSRMRVVGVVGRCRGQPGCHESRRNILGPGFVLGGVQQQGAGVGDQLPDDLRRLRRHCPLVRSVRPRQSVEAALDLLDLSLVAHP